MKGTMFLVTSLAVTVFASYDRPVIGVLTVPLNGATACETMSLARGVHHKTTGISNDIDGGASCFTAYYAKWIEAAGAQVAVIPFDSTDAQLDQLLASVDGVLFTGGGLSLELNTTYDTTAMKIFNYTKTNTFTLWGTCMGFQLLNVLAANDRGVLERYAFDAEAVSWPLNISININESKLWSQAPVQVLKILQTENVTENLHHDGVTPETFQTTPALNGFYKMLSTNNDRKGKAFVSTIEAKEHSIFGVQWHPERPQFEWVLDEGLNHSASSVYANSWMARFFIDQARQTGHDFDFDALKTSLIYSHDSSIVNPTGDSYEFYIFGPKGAVATNK